MKIEEISLTEEALKMMNEDDLLFITFPGRMGDIYGCSFAIQKNDHIKFYRIENLADFNGNIYQQFPKWNEDLKNYSQKEKLTKYEIIYMGMGNLLGVDKTIVDEFKSLIEERVNEIKGNYDDSLKFGMTCYTYWREVANNLFQK